MARPVAPSPTLPPATPYFNDGAASEAFVPLEGGQARVGAPPPTGVARPAFQYLWNPTAWTVVDDMVVPRLYAMPLVPGIDGVTRDDNGRGKILAGQARDKRAEKGWKPIPFDAVPDAHVAPGQAKSYVTRPKGRPDLHVSIYEKTYPGTDTTEPDVARLKEWFNYLYAAKIVERPQPWVLRKMLATARDQAQIMAKRAETMPTLKSDAEALTKQADAIEAELGRAEKRVREVPATPAESSAVTPEGA